MLSESVDRVVAFLRRFLVSEKSYEELPKAEPEPPANRSMDALANSFGFRMRTLHADLNRVLSVIGHRADPIETHRSDERQAWLYSIGRTHRDPLFVPAKRDAQGAVIAPARGRTGIVTNVQTTGKHGLRKAVDMRYVRIDGRPARRSDYLPTLERFAAHAPARYGIRWGGTFTGLRDEPHWEDLDS